MGVHVRGLPKPLGWKGCVKNLFNCVVLVLVLFFPFLIRKNLSHSGRFGLEENKRERKVFFYPEIGAGGSVSPMEPASRALDC